jgi:protein ImuA
MPPGRPGETAFLRDAIARIESGGQGAAVHFSNGNNQRRITGHDTAGNGPKCASNGMQLDHILHGAVTRGALHEIVAASPGDAAAASGFALALAARFAAAFPSGAPIIWILEDHAKTETGAPYAPGLAAYGIDPARLIIVETASGQDSLWAMEEALKCRAVAAVAAEIWRLKSYDLTASRRLVLAAKKSGTPGLLVPSSLAGLAPKLSSAAQARFEVRARPGPHGTSAGERMPLPGCAAWDIRAARIRAGPEGRQFSLDYNRFWPVLWNHEEACLRDAFPLPLSAQARDRPHARMRSA